MKKYKWKLLSQWDVLPDNVHFQVKEVKTRLSQAYCRYMLCEEIYIGRGRIKIIPILKNDVTEEMLETAGQL